jgi:DNA-binding NtrC family response regulator
MLKNPHKILVVDDIKDWRLTLGGLLEDEGYEVQVAGSSAEAMKVLGADHFDLAVLDIRLDETDEDNKEGLNLAAQIRERWPKVKVIIITGYGTPTMMREAMEPDAEGKKLAANYVPKTESEDLVKIVQKALAR